MKPFHSECPWFFHYLLQTFCVLQLLWHLSLGISRLFPAQISGFICCLLFIPTEGWFALKWRLLLSHLHWWWKNAEMWRFLIFLIGWINWSHKHSWSIKVASRKHRRYYFSAAKWWLWNLKIIFTWTLLCLKIITFKFGLLNWQIWLILICEKFRRISDFGLRLAFSWRPGILPIRLCVFLPRFNFINL